MHFSPQVAKPTLCDRVGFIF